MATDAVKVRKRRALWGTRNGMLLAAAILSSAVAWWMIAWPVATLSNMPKHQGHFALTFAHMVGGTGMLFLPVAILGLAANFWLVSEWLGRGLGPLEIPVTMRYALWGLTAIVAGVQTIYSSFFLSMLKMNRN